MEAVIEPVNFAYDVIRENYINGTGRAIVSISNKMLQVKENLRISRIKKEENELVIFFGVGIEESELRISFCKEVVVEAVDDFISFSIPGEGDISLDFL